jgi:N6-adenosine-specific RNA methylase IME4
MTAGTGSYTMQGHEFMFLATRGEGFSSGRAVRNVRNTLFAPLDPLHSKKPEAAQDLLERLWPGLTPRLELFARRRRPGWACYGNQLPDSDLVFGDAVGLSFPTTPKPARTPRVLAAQGGLFDEVTT